MFSSRWLLAPALAVAVAIGVACGGDSDDDNNANTGASSTGGAVATGGTGATGSTGSTGATGSSSQDGTTVNMSDVAAALEDVESFRFNIKMKMDFDLPDDGSDETGMAGMLLAFLSDIEAQGEFAAPDSVHVKTEIMGMPLETIQIGEQSWIYDGNAWTLNEPGSGTSFDMGLDFSNPSEAVTDFLPEEELKGAKTSKESVNGIDTTRYSFDKESLAALAESAGDATGMEDLSEMDTMTLDLWLTEDNLPVKMKMLVEGQSEGSDMAMDLEFNITDLNADISIEAPI